MPFAQETSEEPEIKLSASFRRKLSVGITSFLLPVTGVESGKAASVSPGQGQRNTAAVGKKSKQHLFPSCLLLGNQSSLYSFN